MPSGISRRRSFRLQKPFFLSNKYKVYARKGLVEKQVFFFYPLFVEKRIVTMKNKAKKWLNIILFASAFSLFAPLVSSFSDSAVLLHSEEVQSKSVYVDASSNELLGEEGVALSFNYKTDQEHVVPLSFVGDGIYQTEEAIPLSLFEKEEYVFFISIADVNDAEYQTAEIKGGNSLQKDGYNCVCLGDLNEENQIELLGFGWYGKWSENAFATAATQRVWLSKDDGKPISKIDTRDASIRPSVQFFAENKIQIINMASCLNAYDGKTYYYADIPYQLTRFNFLLTSNEKEYPYLIYDDIEVKPIVYGSCYFLSESEEEFTVATFSVNGADATILSLVVESYLTYGKSESNGAISSTISNVFSTWFKNKSATTDDLKAVKIKDYTGSAYKDGEYDATVPKGGEYSVNEKWNTLCSNAGIDPKTGEMRTFSLSFNFSAVSVFLIIGIAALVPTALWLAFFLFKRHRSR